MLGVEAFVLPPQPKLIAGFSPKIDWIFLFTGLPANPALQ